MKIEILFKDQEMKFNCESIKSENGFLIIGKPSNENINPSTEELWIPLGFIQFVNILEK